MGSPKPNAGHVAAINKSPFKRYVWYALVSTVLLSLGNLLFFLDFEDIGLFYPILQLYSVVLGSCHLYLLDKKLTWSDPSPFWRKAFYSLLIVLLAIFLFYLIGYFLVAPIDRGYQVIYMTAILPFLLPFLIVAAFVKAMQIPDKVFKLWFYSDVTHSLDPDLIDFSNSYLLSFEFPKKYGDSVISNFKFKAPLDMQFGELFYNYIKEYNDAHRENPIEYQDNKSKSYGWLFTAKKNAWWKENRILDPHMTIRQNRLQEHDVIMPKRYVVDSTL